MAASRSFVVAALAVVVVLAFAHAFTVDQRVVGAHGGIMFLSGDLGSIPTPINVNRVQHYVRSTLAPVYGLSGAEQFEHVKTNVDRQNNTHTFFQQFVMFHGKRVEVDGGQLIVHASVDGNVFAVSSSLLAFHSDASYADVKIQHAGKQAIAAAVAKPDLALLSSPELVFLLHDDQAYFAYRAMVSYFHAEQNLPFQSRVFASPQTAELIVEFPMVFTLENRTIYTANQKTTLPGTLERTETSGKVNDQVVNQAFDNAGVCYEFYFKAFNRDSWDGKGAPMLSTVHYDKNYNNAFWNGQQMVYGDGDGVNFSDFAGDLSVVCHELTHAVVGTTAGLRYLGESGALNEAYADMMGSSAVIFNEGGLKATSWQIGNKCYLAGEALRYMNNPILDGVSRDYYPDRYVGIVDNGGVHWNSGIANLFYVLLVQGGVHPQQKTTNYVNPVGIVPALDIIYDTLVNYLTSTSNFAATRAAMAVSTKALFPNNDAMLSSVNGAWTAVGVN